MKILISAAETSSDAHGAELLRELRALAASGASTSESGFEAFGAGGPKLEAAGLRRVVDAGDLLAMGFGEIIGRLPRILRALRVLAESARRQRPDVAVLIDYPDFHMRLARKLRKQGIPVVYFIPPKVWAWRSGRVRSIRELFARVLCIFPFEQDYFLEHGVDALYVGNPLLDELPLSLTREQARAKLGLDARAKVLVLMPGSRPAEIRQHLELMLDSALSAAGRLREERLLSAGERLVVRIPLPETSDSGTVRMRLDQWLESRRGDGFPLEIALSVGNAHECLCAADAGLVKSGTSTLEAALLGCPHSIVYRPGAVSRWIVRKVIRFNGSAGLANRILGRVLPPLAVREFLCEDATAAALASEIRELLTDEGRRGELQRAFAEVRERLKVSESPSRLAARAIWELGRS